jgi:hypothetical protein
LTIAIRICNCAPGTRRSSASPRGISIADLAVVPPKHTRVLLRLAVAAIAFAVLTHTRADPDLFGNVRFGHDIVAARSAHLSDPYSFTSDRPWINHEWLSETAMYLAYAEAGTPGLLALKLLIVVAMLAGVLAMLRATEAPPLAQDLLVSLVVVGTFAQTNQIRPQLFSLALFTALLLALVAARRSPRARWWTVPIMIAWVNLHGGWIVGAGVLAVWTLAGLAERRARRDKIEALAVCGLALAATLANPYGWRMWAFLRETVDFGRAEIGDWQPVFALGTAYGLLWTIVAAAAVMGIVAAAARRRFDAQAAAIVLMLGVASFRVNRLLAFFTIGVVMLLGPAIGDALARRKRAPAAAPTARLATAATLALAIAVIGGGAALSARNLSCIQMDETLFPDSDVASFAAARGLHGRMLTWFDWGHYAIWYFSPGVRISIDGRRETVYSSRTIERQLRFYYAPEDRQAILDELKPDFILLPIHLKVADRLIEDGWTPVFSGDRSVLLARGSATTVYGHGSPERSRCFPGP